MAKSVIINNVVYPDVPSVTIPLQVGGEAEFYDDSVADAENGDVLAGKVFFHGGQKTGTMPNNGATGGAISTKDGTVTIPTGYTSGGSVSIDSAEQEKIIADNIKSGVTILGQAGSSTVVDTEISSDAASASTILNGKKAYVNGALVTGSVTTPTISQDSTTKVLSIS